MQADRAALSVHTVFSTACAPYFDWQSAGLGLSHRRVRQPGPLTRLIACSDAYYAERSLRVPHIGTHVHPDYGRPDHNRVQDMYAPYNKPGGVAHWLKNAQFPPTEDFVLILESDMVMRRRAGATSAARPPAWRAPTRRRRKRRRLTRRRRRSTVGTPSMR